MCVWATEATASRRMDIGLDHMSVFAFAWFKCASLPASSTTRVSADRVSKNYVTVRLELITFCRF